MEHYLFVARSITHAQQMMKILSQSGIHVRARRAGHALTGRGCGYTLDIPGRYYETALARLRQAQVKPLAVFRVKDGEKIEVDA